MEEVLTKKPKRLVLMLENLESMANVGIRVLLFARQRMDISDRADIYAVAPNKDVREALLRADPDQEDINVVESYDPFRDSTLRRTRAPGVTSGRRLPTIRAAQVEGPPSGGPSARHVRVDQGGGGSSSIDEALADLDDVAVGVRDPGRPPARDEVVEAHGTGGDARVAAQLGELRVDVVDLEREVAPAGVVGARSGGLPGRDLSGSP